VVQGIRCYTGRLRNLSLLPCCFVCAGTHGYEEHCFEANFLETIFIATAVFFFLRAVHFDVCK